MIKELYTHIADSDADTGHYGVVEEPNQEAAGLFVCVWLFNDQFKIINLSRQGLRAHTVLIF